ncbi:hypothetical protein PG993_006213 [Apiospora rasikravindrae]|uniref:Uncharacterized protein n=1 Tax=Apiospora rasikravindrae TaxID=990691 RepID=A0ABR1T6W1_9PEZI
MAPQQVFVQQLAFMEGVKGVIPDKETLATTLENVNVRVSVLERLVSRPQVPTAVPDWDSLRYRTMRLWRTPMTKWLRPPALERTLRSLGIFSYSAALDAAKETEGAPGDDADEGKGSTIPNSSQFDIALQDFCRLAGKHRYQPPKPLTTVRELYAAAFELSLVLEGKPASPVQYPPPPGYYPPGIHGPGIPPMGWPVTGPPAPPFPPNVMRVGKRKPKKKAPKKGGFLRFMACGRQDDSDSDSGSDSDDESIRARTGWRRFLPRWLSRGRAKKRHSGYDTDTSSCSSSLAD